MTRRTEIARHYQQEKYVLPCDGCKGRRYIGHEICVKCGGLGTIIVLMPRLSFYDRNPGLSRGLLFIAVLILTAVAVSLILS